MLVSRNCSPPPLFWNDVGVTPAGFLRVLTRGLLAIQPARRNPDRARRKRRKHDQAALRPIRK